MAAYTDFEPTLPPPGLPVAPRHGVWQALAAQLGALLHPIPREQRRLNQPRRRQLPAHLQLPHQTLGISHHSCGATHSLMERCNFACTSCYLSAVANAAQPLPWPEVRAQLDALRAFLGPRGKAQITSGEVTLLPCDVLGSYVAYARQIGLEPMVMSHGERLLEEPEYLYQLVSRYGLAKLSIHLDITQRGRRGWRPGLREPELHPLRERYAELIREVRRRTGRRLEVAHTVTVTADNLADVPAVVDWMCRHADAFRIVSFQPVAAVGRTRDNRVPGLTMDTVWEQVCAGFGQPLNRQAVLFGHPECNIVAPVVVVGFGARRLIVELAREGHAWDRGFLGRALSGGLGEVPLLATGRNRRRPLGMLAIVLRNLPVLLEAPWYGLYRMWGLRRSLLALAAHLARLRPITIRPLAVVVHKFMSPEELATPLGQERLQSCVFHLPVKGRMVPMCEVNATELRLELNRALRPQPPASSGSLPPEPPLR